jgi:hypothetical protein
MNPEKKIDLTIEKKKTSTIHANLVESLKLATCEIFDSSSTKKLYP